MIYYTFMYFVIPRNISTSFYVNSINYYYLFILQYYYNKHTYKSSYTGILGMLGCEIKNY